MPKLAQILAIAVALGVLALAPRARAQTATTISLGPIVGHSDAATRPSMPLTYINRNDCLSDDVISFPVVFSPGDLNQSLEIWAGSGCDQSANRTSSTNTTCWLVYKETIANATQNVPIHVRDLLCGASSASTVTVGTGGTAGASGSGGIAGDSGTGGTAGDSGTGGTAGDSTGGTAGTGVGIASGACMVSTGSVVQNTSIDVCTPAGGPAPPTTLTVYFLIISNTIGSTAAASTTWAATFKLLGPVPPVNLSPGVGENELIISFDGTTTSQDPSANGFTAFCDPPPSGGGSLDGGLQPCTTSTVLIPGNDPPAGYQCGSSAKGASQITATGLTNGEAYNVAVSAVDTYFNTGALSASTCERPQPVTSFYQAYRDAGGKDGGGFCSFSPRNAGRATLSLFGLIGLGALLRRRAR